MIGKYLTETEEK